MDDLFVESWGDGPAVVLAHGSLATGTEEWEAQRPLAEEGFRLVVFDRRGYGRSPAADGEDLLRDGEDIAGLMGDGAHLVGHSYGGLGAMVAAARRPEATLSLVLLEPAALALGQDRAAGRALLDGLRQMWDLDLPDEEWVVRFLKVVGSNPDELPPEFSPLPYPWCAWSGEDGRCGTPTCRSRSWRAPPSRSWSSRAATARASTPSATTSPNGSEGPEPWWRAPGTRSSSPDLRSTTSCSISGEGAQNARADPSSGYRSAIASAMVRWASAVKSGLVSA